MPPTKDSKHRHAKQAPPLRRKSKPKFEIPAEAGSSEAPVGWVYRMDEVAAIAPARSAETAPISAASHAAEEVGKTNPLVFAGMGLFFAAVGSIGLVSVVALGLIAAPIKMATGMFMFGSGRPATD
jgi:hypothetical protein